MKASGSSVRPKRADRGTATEASALSEALSSYRLPSTSNWGRLYVPDVAAAPVKVSLSAACNCRGESFAFETVLRLGPYEDLLRAVVLRLKQSGSETLAEVVGEGGAPSGARRCERWPST
jgi:hypothetical protein